MSQRVFISLSNIRPGSAGGNWRIGDLSPRYLGLFTYEEAVDDAADDFVKNPHFFPIVCRVNKKTGKIVDIISFEPTEELIAKRMETILASGR